MQNKILTKCPIYLQITAEEIRQRKFLRRGLQLSIMVVGEMGTGKSTFINTLCDEDVIPVDEAHGKKQLSIDKYSTTIFEGGTKINLDIVLASGFGDSVDNSTCTSKIVKYIDDQFEAALKEECKIQRTHQFNDSRVHAAIYFIRPTGKGLRPLDIQCIKALSQRCNVIPVISKGDLLTEVEKAVNRKCIMRDLKKAEIPIYDFTASFEDIGEMLPGVNINDLIPMSIVSGTERKIIDDVEYKVRKLPHGIVRVDDPSHSDFLLLRTCLLGACLQDLKDTTEEIYYEKYRTEKLSEASKKSTLSSASPSLSKVKSKASGITAN